MIKSFINSAIKKFETRYNYDSGYMREILDTSIPLTLKFNGFVKLSGYRKQAPKDILFTAKIAALKVGDCGPCLQLVVDFAREAGVEHATVESAVRTPEKLSADQKLAYDFATAVAENADTHSDLAAKFEKRFGQAVRVEVAMAIATALVYPTLKRGLGHAVACQLVKVKV